MKNGKAAGVKELQERVKRRRRLLDKIQGRGSVSD